MGGTSSTVGLMVLAEFRENRRASAFANLAFGRYALWSTKGLSFYRTLGSGRNAGFSGAPSLTRQGLFLSFLDDHAANAFLEESAILRFLQDATRELATVRLRAYASRGAWAGRQPLSITAERPITGPVASLTRASIHLSKVRSFWNHAAPSEAALRAADGCLLSAGLGEVPLIRQATFTVWRDERALVTYARNGPHDRAAQDAYARAFFSESLFARFVPYDMRGIWHSRQLAAIPHAGHKETRRDGVQSADM